MGAVMEMSANMESPDMDLYQAILALMCAYRRPAQDKVAALELASVTVQFSEEGLVVEDIPGDMWIATCMRRASDIESLMHAALDRKIERDEGE